MNDLFRFSVVRAVTRSTPATIDLVTAPAAQQGPNIRAGAQGAQSLQQQLQSIVQTLSTPSSMPGDIWNRMEPAALNFLLTNGSSIIADPMWTSLGKVADDLDSLAAGQNPNNLNTVAAIFGAQANLTNAAVTAYQPKVSDLFLAAIIVRHTGPQHLIEIVRQQNAWTSLELLQSKPSLVEIADRLTAASTFLAGAAALTDNKAIRQALSSTIMFPPGLFSPLRKPTFGVGFRELHVVRQHIRRYELAEVGRIENILKGETRTHSQKHSLSTEQDTFTSTSTTSETDKELSSSDRTDIKNEADDQLKTATKVDAGVHASYDSGSFKLQTDLTVGYDESSDKTKKYSSDVAKDVTQKAVSKVTQTVTRNQTTKIIQTFNDFELQKFNNVSGSAHISGVYQWVEKVYLSQVFNLGRHMLLDMMVPEPAANLLALATLTSAEDPPPVQPYPLGTIKMLNGQPVLDRFGQLQLDIPLDPLSLTDTNQPPTPNFYGTWVGRYGATGVAPPPDITKAVTKPISFSYSDDDTKSSADVIQIPDGYAATSVSVNVSAMCNDQRSAAEIYIEISVGGAVIHLGWPAAGSAQRLAQLPGAANLPAPVSGSVGYSIYAPNIDEMVINIQLNCTRRNSLLDQWRLQTYEKIAAAYQNLQTAYMAAMAARKMATKTVGPLGAQDPEANRLTERTELKRLCIGVMDQNDATIRGTDVATTTYQVPPVSSTVDPSNPTLPEIILDKNADVGERVRWFEEAFEWENIAYVLYPYFWGRRSNWVPATVLTNDDPLFLNFLQSGYARVVVPVRLGFERAVHMYLHTGIPWRGGELPAVGDKTQNPLYLDVAEELKALTGGGESGEFDEPIGDPWEYTIPTTVMKLRPDDQLPEWHRAIPAQANPAEYSSNAPDGDWTWKDGAPA